MVGLTPRLCLLLPAMLHPAGRPSSGPTWPFRRQCVGEAGRAGSSLRVTLPPGVSPLSRGFRSGGLTLLPSLPWGHAAAPAAAATAAGTSATANCRPSSSFLASCRCASLSPAAWPHCSPGDPTCTGAGATGPSCLRRPQAPRAEWEHTALGWQTQPWLRIPWQPPVPAWCHPPASTGTEHPYHGGHTPPRWHARASPYSVTNRARRASECALPAP